MADRDDTRQFGPCPKCTGIDIGIRWHKNEYSCTYAEQKDMYANSLAKQEHLHASCRRCGYHWTEAPS